MKPLSLPTLKEHSLPTPHAQRNLPAFCHPLIHTSPVQPLGFRDVGGRIQAAVRDHGTNLGQRQLLFLWNCGSNCGSPISFPLLSFTSFDPSNPSEIRTILLACSIKSCCLGSHLVKTSPSGPKTIAKKTKFQTTFYVSGGSPQEFLPVGIIVHLLGLSAGRRARSSSCPQQIPQGS